MEKKDIIWTATMAFAKNMDYEELLYSDDMYDDMDKIDDVWDYVKEIREKGADAFYEKYPEYKFY